MTDPDRHVHAVKSGERKEARREQAVVNPRAFSIEGRELVDLAGDEQAAEQRRHAQEDLGVAQILAIGCD